MVNKEEKTSIGKKDPLRETLNLLIYISMVFPITSISVTQICESSTATIVLWCRVYIMLKFHTARPCVVRCALCVVRHRKTGHAGRESKKGDNNSEEAPPLHPRKERCDKNLFLSLHGQVFTTKQSLHFVLRTWDIGTQLYL